MYLPWESSAPRLKIAAPSLKIMHEAMKLKLEKEWDPNYSTSCKLLPSLLLFSQKSVLDFSWQFLR